MIKKGDKLRIRPEYMDAGDDEFDWYALEDEDGGRVRIQPDIKGMAIKPNQVVNSFMVEAV